MDIKYSHVSFPVLVDKKIKKKMLLGMAEKTFNTIFEISFSIKCPLVSLKYTTKIFCLQNTKPINIYILAMIYVSAKSMLQRSKTANLSRTTSNQHC
jgi:hypothetical protein